MNNKFVWTNPYLPQTLQYSVLLAYFQAAFAVVGLIIPQIFGTYTSFGYLLTVLAVLGAFGIANLRLWGYFIAVAVSIVSLITIRGIVTRPINPSIYFHALFSSNNLVNLIFGIAIIALVLHPMSRNYVKKNFVKTIP